MPKKLLLFFIVVILSSGFAQADFYQKLADSAYSLSKQFIIYEPTYYRLDYPNDDIRAHKGVCTDVLIRAYRKPVIFLPKEVHEDMKQHFNLYHHRASNLMVFFARHGKAFGNSNNA